ncbi:MAG: lipoprotein [Bacilli bacterium]|nr:lipoprotein [Bacilli bacterium]
MKKIVLFLSLLFLVSGCSINYNLEFSGEDILEEIDFSLTESEYDEWNSNQSEKFEEDGYVYFNSQQLLAFSDDYEELHKRILNRNGNSYDVNYLYKYNYKNYNRSMVIDSCFSEYNILNKDDYYYVKLDGPFTCFYDDMNINIKTDRKVIHTNGEYNNGVYTWKITEDNFKDFELIFHIDKDEVFDELEVIDDVKKENNIQISDIIWIIILGAAFVGLIILSKKFKKTN